MSNTKEILDGLREPTYKIGCPDCKKLKEFARWVIKTQCWGYGETDGGDIQEKAESVGLLKMDTVTKNDVENLIYYSKDDIGETTIYRFTDIMEEK